MPRQDKWLLWPRPAFVFPRPLLGVLAHMRTTASVDLALLQIVEQLQFADHPSACEFDAERALRSSGQLALLADFLIGAVSNIGRLIQLQQLTSENASNHATFYVFELANTVGKPSSASGKLVDLGGQRFRIVKHPRAPRDRLS